MDLNNIINNIDSKNCYDMVVKFFGLTSTLEDNLDEICQLPLKGVNIFGIKSDARKQAEADRTFFVKEVGKAGRDCCSHNRTEPQEPVTKDNVYFGGVDGLNTYSVARFERAKDDQYVQDSIRWQIVDFVRSYRHSFKFDWLR